MSAVCRSCGAEIQWCIMKKSGRKMPLDVATEQRIVVHSIDGSKDLVGELVTVYTSHFATCPNADKHRGKGKSC